MKKFKVISLVCTAIALVLEILPISVRMKWADFYSETSTYHSYFDLTVWGYGDMAPFICGIITVVILGMLIGSFFIKPRKQYTLAVAILSLATVMLSIVPAFFDSYTIAGLAITVLMAAATETCFMTYLNENK